MQFDNESTFITGKLNFVLGRQEDRLLSLIQIFGWLVASGDQQTTSCANVISPHHQVQIDVTAQVRILVRRNSQRWSLVGYGLDPVHLELSNYRYHFICENQISRRVLLVVFSKSL